MFAQVSRDNDPTNAMFFSTPLLSIGKKQIVEGGEQKQQKQRMVLKETDSRKLTR